MIEPTIDHLATLPVRRAAEHPGGRCLDDDRLDLTNVEFAQRVDATAAMLASHGVGAGDVVATVLTNRVELVVVMFATWQVGATLTPVNPAQKANEAEFQLSDSASKVVVHEGSAFQLDDATLVDVADLPTTGGFGGATVPSATDPSALALLIYTSGTTGTPKGVELDHANLIAMVTGIIEATGLGATDRCLLILPLFHVNGIVVSILSPLAVGGSTSITARFSPLAFFDIIARERPTYFSAVPAIYAMLSTLPDGVEPDVSSVRFAVCGAAPMPAELIERFEQRFSLPIVEGYGLSEATCASTLNPIDGVHKPGTVGVALPGQEVILLGEDGRPTTEGRGEVIIRGPIVMRGYLGRPEETPNTLVDGWLRTGDVGAIDEVGYLSIVDRLKDMIIRGGENIYPKGIENVLYGHPEVLEAAVVGRPDDVLGEVPVAYVSLRNAGATTAEELLARCADRLARYKVAVQITIIDNLPKNPIGKMAKPDLRSRSAQAAG